MKYLSFVFFCLFFFGNSEFICRFKQKQEQHICWGISYLCQLDHLISENSSILKEIENLKLDIPDMQKKICQTLSKKYKKTPEICSNKESKNIINSLVPDNQVISSTSSLDSKFTTISVWFIQVMSEIQKLGFKDSDFPKLLSSFFKIDQKSIYTDKKKITPFSAAGLEYNVYEKVDNVIRSIPKQHIVYLDKFDPKTKLFSFRDPQNYHCELLFDQNFNFIPIEDNEQGHFFWNTKARSVKIKEFFELFKKNKNKKPKCLSQKRIFSNQKKVLNAIKAMKIRHLNQMNQIKKMFMANNQ